MDLEIAVMESILANAKDQHQLKAGLTQAVKLLHEAVDAISDVISERDAAAAKRDYWFKRLEEVERGYEAMKATNAESTAYAELLKSRVAYWDDRFQEAMQDDSESGVKWLNEQAAAAMRRACPDTLKAIGEFGEWADRLAESTGVPNLGECAGADSASPEVAGGQSGRRAAQSPSGDLEDGSAAPQVPQPFSPTAEDGPHTTANRENEIGTDQRGSAKAAGAPGAESTATPTICHHPRATSDGQCLSCGMPVSDANPVHAVGQRECPVCGRVGAAVCQPGCIARRESSQGQRQAEAFVAGTLIRCAACDGSGFAFRESAQGLPSDGKLT